MSKPTNQPTNTPPTNTAITSQTDMLGPGSTFVGWFVGNNDNSHRSHTERGQRVGANRRINRHDQPTPPADDTKRHQTNTPHNSMIDALNRFTNRPTNVARTTPDHTPATLHATLHNDLPNVARNVAPFVAHQPCNVAPFVACNNPCNVACNKQPRHES